MVHIKRFAVCTFQNGVTTTQHVNKSRLQQCTIAQKAETQNEAVQEVCASPYLRRHFKYPILQQGGCIVLLWMPVINNDRLQCMML
jgi:hypothetical protein